MEKKATNLTVLGVAPLAATIPVVGAVLIMLFVLIKPEATAGFVFHQRLLFWTVHITLGLASLAAASRLLRVRPVSALPLWTALLVSGAAGAAVLTPLYLYLETFIPSHLVAAPDDWLDRLALRGAAYALLAEFLEVLPVFLCAWLAVNLPLILARPERAEPPRDDPPDPGNRRVGDAAAPGVDPGEPSLTGFWERVPRELGQDVVLISSDMHYLHVHTVRGKCMILGTLRDAAKQLADRGMLVHRSHWVAHQHVRKITRQGSAVSCLMSNDMRVPVSRRKRKAVTERYGHSGNVVSLTAEKPQVLNAWGEQGQ